MPDAWNEAFNLIKDYLQYLGSRIIDVGTGFGTLTNFLLENTYAEIVSIDPDELALQKAKINFEKYIKQQRLKLYKASGENIPFADKYFDSAISMMSMHHVSNISKGIREMMRVSKKILIIVDWKPNAAGVFNPHSADELKIKMSQVISEMQKLQASIVNGEYWYGCILKLK
jgi:Methylase involved in ubiquinone/menaquinone biosynthesis